MSDTATGAVPAQQDLWRRVARDLADDLAVDAVDRDRAGKPPYDEVTRLRESGLPAVLAPPGAAGQGMGWADACAIVRRIASVDCSMGELLGRHYVLSWSTRFFAPPENITAWDALAARHQWLWAGDIGSPGPCDPRHSDDGGTLLTPTPDADGGYFLNGHRDVASAVNVADRLVLDGVCTATNASVVVLVDPRHPGVGRDLFHDRLGQRLTGAGTVHFEDVPVGAADVLGTVVRDEVMVAPFPALAPLALRLMLTHVALGTAEGALAEARDLSRRAAHIRRPDDGPYRPGRAADLPAGPDADLLLAYGELALAVHTAAAVVVRATAAMEEALLAGRGLDHAQCADTAAHVAIAQAVTAKAALHTGERVLDLTDAEGFDRFWRNIRVLVGRGPVGPTLRAIGDHFVNYPRD